MTSGWDSREMPLGVLRSAPGLALRPLISAPISTWQAGWMIQWGFFSLRINSRSYRPLLPPPASPLGSTGSSALLVMGKC